MQVERLEHGEHCSQLQLAAADGSMGGVFEVMGSFALPKGRVPLLEVKYMFFGRSIDKPVSGGLLQS